MNVVLALSNYTEVYGHVLTKSERKLLSKLERDWNVKMHRSNELVTNRYTKGT